MANTARKLLRVLNESSHPDTLDKLVVVCRDSEGSLAKLLNAIKRAGNGGHSFSIIVDPDTNGGEKFFWDGDGSDYIQDVAVQKARK